MLPCLLAVLGDGGVLLLHASLRFSLSAGKLGARLMDGLVGSREPWVGGMSSGGRYGWNEVRIGL